MKKTLTVLAGILLLSACVAPPPPAPQTTTATPAAVATSELPAPSMPPRDDPTPETTEPAELPLDQPPAQPLTQSTPTAALPLPPGVVSETLASPIPPADGLRVLYLDGGLRIWNVEAGTNDDLGWPAHAIACPVLGEDGHTFYFSDQRGASSIDLTAPVSPTLLVENIADETNMMRSRSFCVTAPSGDGKALLMMARDLHWYQLGVLAPETGVLRVVESPIGPPGEPWNCPGSSAWGQGNTILLSGYSQGSCVQSPGLFRASWGEPLVPSPVLTGTLPALEGRLPTRAGAWFLRPNADHSRIAFWFDKDYARPDGTFMSQALGVVDGAGENLVWLTDGIAGRNGPPAWSADGQSVYIATAEQFDVLDPHPWQIRRIGLDGQEEVVAELNERFVVLVAPEREGKLLLQLMNDSLGYDTYVLDLATGELIAGPAGWLIDWLP